MMDEVLRDYLGSITTPENQTTLLTTIRLLTDLGVVSHHDDIARILQTIEVQDTPQNLLDFFTLLSEYASTTIQAFGVGIAEEVPLNVLNEILEGFIILSNYGDPEHLLVISEGVEEVGPEETLCELLGAVRPQDWYDFAPYVENVSEDFLGRLKAHCESRLPPEDERPDITPYRDRFLAFSSDHTSLLATEWLYEGGHFQTPLTQLLDHYEEALSVPSLGPKELVDQLTGLLLVSDCPLDDYHDVAKALLEDFLEDPLKITRAYQHLLTTLKELSLEKT